MPQPSNNIKHLTIVGTGIKTYSHITKEAEGIIKAADAVFYLLNEPLSKEWISQLNANAISIDDLYSSTCNREENYHLIADRVIDSFSEYKNIAYVTYGHPTIFSTPSAFLVEKCKQLSINVVALPAISADLCLFADLLIDPSKLGWQSYECSHFIANVTDYNKYAHLILWQIGAIAEQGLVKHEANNPIEHLKLLSKKLLLNYPEQHECVIYEAAAYASSGYYERKVTIKELMNEKVSPISSLYIPPIE